MSRLTTSPSLIGFITENSLATSARIGMIHLPFKGIHPFSLTCTIGSVNVLGRIY